MKTKKLKGILNLNKTTIARLNETEIREVNGGANRTNTCDEGCRSRILPICPWRTSGNSFLISKPMAADVNRSVGAWVGVLIVLLPGLNQGVGPQRKQRFDKNKTNQLNWRNYEDQKVSKYFKPEKDDNRPFKRKRGTWGKRRMESDL